MKCASFNKKAFSEKKKISANQHEKLRWSLLDLNDEAKIWEVKHTSGASTRCAAVLTRSVHGASVLSDKNAENVYDEDICRDARTPPRGTGVCVCWNLVRTRTDIRACDMRRVEICVRRDNRDVPREGAEGAEGV